MADKMVYRILGKIMTSFVLSAIATLLLIIIVGLFIPSEVPPQPIDALLFTHFLTVGGFTVSVLMFGRCLFTTAMKAGLHDWRMLSYGTYLLFIFGCANIAEHFFEPNLFSTIKDLTLVAGSILIVWSIVEIAKSLEGE
ncbi:MAG: hypothetical protein QXJ68_01155 [Methanocellales archaeon]